jgi:energy-coupling factor transporter ATP-binding protein EcfA2
MGTTVRMQAAGLGMDRTETLTKCLELKEAMQTHRGVLLVGPSGVGKTTCYTVLAAALESTAKAIQSKENLHHHHQNRGHLSSPAIKSLMQMGGTGKIQLSVISPRAVALRHLYGSHDNQSNQWEDGILSSVMRRGAAQHATQHPTWLVMDGEMTSSWVEGLHSALDSTSQVSERRVFPVATAMASFTHARSRRRTSDSEIVSHPALAPPPQFCLDNGERIKLPPIGHMNLLFEDVTLSHASPSLVGRCGVVCFKQAVEWWPLVETAIR